ncbi:alpha/beta-hydrolase [Aulographum hederae CBS 113979]|uniref:Alpha/beta-hydrolase n=1 Tax=Aulographum hederae CBS 113979 TaxID=1176131 RepID=A0A6G1GKU8_9PEZI|nr:alpha/beta-hydrolase [Aulographum hederae CBS 113979]
MSTTSNPTIVLVGGAWHVPAHYEPLLNLLRKTHTVHVPHNPSSSLTPPPKALDADVSQVRDLATRLADEGKDILVLAHSYGGVVSTEAFSGLGKEQRRKEGKEGGVVRAVWICGHLPFKGMSLVNCFGAETIGEDTDSMLITSNQAEIFYNDVPDDLAKKCVEMLTGHPVSAQIEGKVSSEESWKGFPLEYIVCTLDVAIPKDLQLLMVQKVRDTGKEVRVHELESGHSPFLSMPEKVKDIIIEV